MENKIDELAALKQIVNSAFTLDMNANDFFNYSCAHSVLVESDDLVWITPIVQKYPNSGLDACIAYIANIKPIAPWLTDEFNEAIEELKKSKPRVKGDIDNSESYNKKGPYRKIKR